MINQTIEDKEKRIKALEAMIHRMSEAGKADEDTIDDLGAQVVELQERAAKDQQFVAQKLAEIAALEAENKKLEYRLEFVHSTIDDMNDCCRDYKEENLRLKDELNASQDNTAFVIGLYDLCFVLCSQRHARVKELEKSVEELIVVNTTLREHLDQGILLAEDTIQLLESKQPMITALAECHKDGTIAECLSDAEFLETLCPGGGGLAILRLVQAVIAPKELV